MYNTFLLFILLSETQQIKPDKEITHLYELNSVWKSRIYELAEFYSEFLMKLVDVVGWLFFDFLRY